MIIQLIRISHIICKIKVWPNTFYEFKKMILFIFSKINIVDCKIIIKW
jgi:hypothetical protein